MLNLTPAVGAVWMPGLMSGIQTSSIAWGELNMAESVAEKSRAYRLRKKAELLLLPPEEAEAIVAEKRRLKSEYDAKRYLDVGEQKRANAAAWYEANTERGKATANARYHSKKDEILAQQSAKRFALIEADPTYREREAKANRERIAANPEQYGETRRVWCQRDRAKNPEKYQAKSHARYWADPEKARARGVQDAHTRRARKLEAGGQFTAADVRLLMEKQKGKCLVCLKPFGKTKPHIDHYISLARGGTNDVKNLRLLCRKCNMSKHAKDPIKFGLQNGLLCW